MILFDLINNALSASATEPLACSAANGTFSGTVCNGSALQAITAAYATQGMWVMSDMVNQLVWTKLNALAPLMYLIAAAGGLISLAVGAPPKMYLWFFLGPAMYHWLLETSVPAKGMSWIIGHTPGDMEQVWRLSEVGLVNTNAGKKGALLRNGTTRDVDVNFANNHEPDDMIQIPYFFAWFDDTVSSVIREMIGLTGMFSERAASTGTAQTDTSLPEDIAVNTKAADKWYLLTNVKWGLIQDITDAKIQDPNLRLLLVKFFSSECGDSFAQDINKSAYINALYSQGATIPCSVLSSSANDVTNCNITDGYISENGYTDPIESEEYTALTADLTNTTVPIPEELGGLFKDYYTTGATASSGTSTGADAGTGTFGKSLNVTYDDFINAKEHQMSVRCSDTLDFIIAAFRWQSGVLYHQIINSVSEKMNGQQSEEINGQNVVFSLLYGWDIRNKDGEHLASDAAAAKSGLADDTPQANFIKDLILVHLIRNEMMITSPEALVSKRIQLSADVTQTSSEGHLRYVASKNKMAEFYQWALMIPHMQGVLLYYLAIAYPFACLLMIIPGMHKTVITWMSFWAWAKMWDFGFAIVMALERSVWAMLGSGASISKAFWLIADMQNWGITSVGKCSSTAAGVDAGSNLCPFVPLLLKGADGVTALNLQTDWANQLKIFDRALTVAGSLDLDLQNSYYIYIMAGLYFAVPIVAGQLLLGAKSGMTSLVNNVIGGVGQEAGRQAAGGYQGDLQQRMKNAQAATGFSAYEKSMRDPGGAGGLLANSMKAGNQEPTLNNDANYQSRVGQAASNLADMGILRYQMANGYAGFLGNSPGGNRLRSPTDPAKTTNNGETGKGAENAANNSKGEDPVSSGGSPVSAKAMAAFALVATRNGLASDGKSKAVENQRGINQFKSQADASAYRLAGDRIGKQAEFGAAMQTWKAKNAYANSMAATSAALGGLAGGLDPGGMPTDSTGMAMSGNLNTYKNGAVKSDMQSLGYFSNPFSATRKENNGKGQVVDQAIGGGLQTNIGAQTRSLQKLQRGIDAQVPSASMQDPVGKSVSSAVLVSAMGESLSKNRTVGSYIGNAMNIGVLAADVTGGKEYANKALEHVGWKQPKDIPNPNDK